MNNRILGVAALLVAAFLVWYGHALEAPVSYEPIGPRVFPMIVAGLMGLCGLILLLRGGGQTEPNPSGANLRIALMVVVLVAYAVLFELLGFVLATALMAMLLGHLFGGSWLKSALGGLVLGIALFLLFDKVLDVVLPTGLLGELL
ncbi:MAG: tripartite tricarboxylate transporter TctB family protein [Lautropia sp.]|nr:tripartite tricarboxylate transporter TctB family protein [Lautropia sp.]